MDFFGEGCPVFKEHVYSSLLLETYGPFPCIRADQVSEESQIPLCKVTILLVILWKDWAMVNIILVSHEKRYIQVQEDIGKI